MRHADINTTLRDYAGRSAETTSVTVRKPFLVTLLVTLTFSPIRVQKKSHRKLSLRWVLASSGGGT